MEIGITKQQVGALVVVLMFGGSAIVYAISAALPEAEQGGGPTGQAILEVRICGSERNLPTKSASISQGNLTIDEDNVVSFPVESGVTLGQVFDAINVTFSRTELMGYKNSENMCNGTAYSNEVSVSWASKLEGGEERLQTIDQYRSYELEHGDYILVRYD